MSLNVFSKHYCSYHNVGLKKKLRELFLRLKWAYQRITRGYADFDCYELDWFYGKIISETLQHLANSTHGWPADGNFNRIKIKSPEYLTAAHAANNGKLSLRTAVRLIREDKVDDFLAYAPMHREKMEIIIAAYEDIKDHFWEQFYKVSCFCWMSRKEYINALNLAGLTRDGFNFSIWAYDHRENNINDYMLLLTERAIINRIKDKIKEVKEEIDDE